MKHSILLAVVVVLTLPLVPGFICVESQCDSGEQCADRCQEVVDDLSSLPAIPPATTGICIERSDGVTGCGCFAGRGEGDLLTADTFGTRVGDVFVSTLGCSLTGRLGDCLLPPESFAGCTVGDDAVCENACGLVDSLRADDLSTPITDARLATSDCSFTCVCTVAAAGQCSRVTLGDVSDTDVTLDGLPGGNAVASRRGPCDG